MSYKRELERAKNYRDAITEIIREFSNDVLLGVVHCDDTVSGALARGGDGGPISKGDVSDPTSRAALRLAGREEYTDATGLHHDAEPDTWTERERDVVAEAINECLADLAEAAGHMRRAKRRLPVILDAGAHLRGRADSTSTCKACHRPVLDTRDDRLRSGYCDACRKAWERAEYPDRFAFERDRPKWDPRREFDKPIACGQGHRCCVAKGLAQTEHEHWRAPEDCVDCASVDDAVPQVATG